MGIYGDCLFPWLMDWSVRGKKFQREREAALAEAEGDVLELGFGTGLNLAHYPPAVRTITAADPVRMLPRRVARRVAASRAEVRRVLCVAEALPFGDGRFDCAVSTWTLCTVFDPLAALREIARVLRPGGGFFFLEHGRSGHPGVSRWQDRLNPLQNRVGRGCNLNRRIDELILQAGLDLVRLERFRLEGVPRLVGEMYRGMARPA
ncbi:MAG: class I SAM-dependent methyltransferase [Candidatus Tectomicrobia bacterium]|uniref:Class I SAM-dependent methyltransferase n=1 Tax=Tectimicrobiota bacterium TaxID=2528274 RepID=A0A932I4B3_UNCTE|nr:class I SAM-dependent methyltransferase [Candidatus Tectomicrobia bacterium]